MLPLDGYAKLLTMTPALPHPDTPPSSPATIHTSQWFLLTTTQPVHHGGNPAQPAISIHHIRQLSNPPRTAMPIHYRQMPDITREMAQALHTAQKPRSPRSRTQPAGNPPRPSPRELRGLRGLRGKKSSPLIWPIFRVYSCYAWRNAPTNTPGQSYTSSGCPRHHCSAQWRSSAGAATSSLRHMRVR